MDRSVNNQESIIIKISGMSCNHCVKHIEKALQQTKGIYMARVDLLAEKAFIDFDPSEINGENLLQVIRKAGYEGNISDQ